MTILNNQIQFLLNDQLTEIDFNKEGISPTITVLNYLREHTHFKGVKEGCAEGDCGACTVVIAEIVEEKLYYKAINSCLMFLPQLHGKQLIVIEHLRHKGQLHPVQNAMVQNHGSQCGYCTPGITMSLFAANKNRKEQSKESLAEDLAGNLCRCTGYQSIISAGLFLNKKQKDHFDIRESETIHTLRKINDGGNFIIKSNHQSYYSPAQLNEALELIYNHGESIITNGSTDIALLQTKKFEKLHSIIDLSFLEALKFIKETNNSFIIGAGATLERINYELGNDISVLKKLISTFASKQIRNIATLAGNIASASPISDFLPLLFAMKAKVQIISKKGSRVVNIEDFITGYRNTCLEQGEIIFSIEIPKDENNIVEFYKISKRKDVDIATLSAGFNFKIKDNIIENAVIAFGGMAATPKRAFQTEEFFLGKTISEKLFQEAGKFIEKEFFPISDARSGKEFRMIAAKNLLLKIYLKLNQEH